MTGFVVYVVYNNPSDYPNKFVVRRHEGLTPDKDPLVVADTLKEARKAIPKGLFLTDRNQDDDPCIEEVWI